MKKDSQKTSSQTVKKVIIRIKKYWVFLILSIIMATITVASSLYVPILVGNAIDYIIGPSNVNFRLIAQILAEIGVVIGITALSQWIMNICNNKITYHVTRDIRDEAIEKIEHLPLKYIDGHSYGEIVSRVIADVDQFADGLWKRRSSGSCTGCGRSCPCRKRHPRLLRRPRRGTRAPHRGRSS